jgi:hypothetical protein
MKKQIPISSFAKVPATIVFVFLECLVVTQAILAYRNHFFTVAQMKSIHIAYGLPFLWHFGMWGDLFMISSIAGYLVGRYIYRWRLPCVLVSFTIGTSYASLLSWVYTISTMPEAHIQNHHLTAAGIVHLFYMAVAVSVLIQFFFFTSAISPRLLRVVSILVLFHVFISNHMALGILQVVVPLNWYSGEPLKSIFGWVTIVVVALTLLWRNLKLDSALHDMSLAAVKRMAHLFMYWIEDDIYWSRKDIETPTGLLKFFDSVGARILEWGFFFSVAWAMWLRNGCPDKTVRDINIWIACFLNALPSCFLVLLFGFIYRASRRSAKVELAINEKLFPPGRLPSNWPGSKDSVRVIVSVVCFFSLYIGLAWFADNIYLVSLCMFVIACIDFNTRRLINKSIREYFGDDRYACRQEDKDCGVIKERRDAVRRYLFNLPHLWKEAGRAAGCLFAFCIAMSGYLYHARWMLPVSYLVLIGTLITNEIITYRWRAVRDCRLREIEDENKARSRSGPDKGRS